MPQIKPLYNKYITHIELLHNANILTEIDNDYICPICFWEIDLFIKSENEPSDQNHGLTLVEARQKYKRYGTVLPHLKKYCKVSK